MTPPDIEKLKKSKPKKAKKEGGGSFYIFFIGSLVLAVIAAAVIGVFLSYTAYIQVDSNEQVVILRLGRYHRTLGAGLHFKWPLNIETATAVTTHTMIEEFGFRTITSDVKSKFNKDFEQESLLLTGDLNLTDVRWVVQYRVSNPKNYLFRVKNVKKMIRDITLASMQKVVGDSRVSDVITVSRLDIAKKVKRDIQRSFKRFKMGIEVDLVNIREADPPTEVKPAFNAVNEARQEMEQLVNEGWKYYNLNVPKAKGQAQKIIKEAEGYRFHVKTVAEGEVSRFLAVLSEYKKSPEVTRQRLYFEMLERSLKKSDHLYVSPTRQQGIVPHMQIPMIQSTPKNTKARAKK